MLPSMTRISDTACLIDDQGYIWDPRSQLLRRRFRLHDIRGDVATRLVQTAGCISVDVSPRAIRMHFDARNVSRVAIGGLLYFLHDHRLHLSADRVFVLTDIGKAGAGIRGRVVEVFRTLGQAMNRLQFLADDQGMANSYRFTAIAIDPQRARYHREFSRLLTCWRTSSGHFDGATIMPLLRYEFADRYLLMEQTPRPNGFRVLEAGAGLRIPDPHFTHRMPGTHISGFPDHRYAAWVTATYAAVSTADQPDYSDVSAQIFWPDSGLVQRNYRRMLLPWRASDGRRFLLSVNRPLKPHSTP